MARTNDTFLVLPFHRYLGDTPFYRGEQPYELDWFRQEVVEADAVEFLMVASGTVSGEYDELYFGLYRFDLFGHLDTVHLRHLDVGDDDLRRVRFEEFHPSSAVFGEVEGNIGEFMGDNDSKNFAGRIVIFHHE